MPNLDVLPKQLGSTCIPELVDKDARVQFWLVHRVLDRINLDKINRLGRIGGSIQRTLKVRQYVSQDFGNIKRVDWFRREVD